MKNFTLLIYSLLITIGAYAQAEVFSNITQFGIGSTQIDAGQSGIYDSEGNMIIYGSFKGNLDFDPSANNNELNPLGTPDLFVAKYDQAGGLLWAFNLGRISLNNGMDADGVTIDSNNNICIAGSFSNTVNFNPLGSPIQKVSAGGKDAFLAKYNSDGQLTWVNTFGSLFFDYGSALHVDADDNIFYGLRYNGDVDVDPSANNVVLNPQSGATDAALIKYNSQGEYVWSFEVSTPNNDDITAIKSAQNGKIALGAMTNGSLSGIPQSDMKMFVLNADGSLDWEYNFDNSDNSNEISCFHFADGGESLYVAGRIQGDTDFDPDQGNEFIIQPLFADPFFAKYDLVNQSLIWARYIESGGIEDYVSGIIESGSALLALGSFDNVAIFNPGDFTSQIASQGEMDIYMAAYDKATGNFMEARTFGGSGSEFARDAYFNPNGNVLAIGSYSGSLSLDTDAAPISSNGFTDIFFAEFSFQTNLSDGILSAHSADIMIYPVPASSTIGLEVPDHAVYPIEIKIISIVGKVVKELRIDNASKLDNIDISSLKTGVYILDINMAGQRISKRIVKN
ncbi:T9SS type A sorting domain-containing protein [Cryomorpha ignava]|uniref:T9SS type A sorting domain-containing protein n=1 Tax=Cryomorpha ignava TaxID=101383 RepID=A0A7K3WXE0_9FLAO|nr:T9SS type A sorting domain-containing protein [Cryomorpha ignava]NEN25761.1 T9SS type A sorting domain-containing protein [Cryomorpha ignava]